MGNHEHKLQKEEVQFLNLITIFQKKEIKKFYRDFLEKWPDGFMDLQTFKDFLSAFFQDNIGNFAEHYFRNIDKDKTGKIDFKEFLLYLSTEGSQNPNDRITWLFDLFDIDGNGSIDRSEMVSIFKSALKMTEEDTVVQSAAEKITAEIFERYDKDNSNTLEENEFHDAILENPQSFSMFPVLYTALFATRGK